MSSADNSLFRRMVDTAKRKAVSILPRPARPYSELARMVRYFHTESTPPQVLLLGDSVTERISKLDKDKRTLADFIAKEFNGRYRFVCISHSAYHMKIYEALLNTLRATRHKPEIVILPVNMRSFSPQWDLEPSWQFEREIEACRKYVSDPQRTIPVLRDLPAMPAQYDSFDKTEVKYLYTSFNKVGHFRLMINAKPQSKEQIDFRKKQIFIFHYLYKLTASHAKVKSLIQTVKTLQAMKIRLLVYITPVNYQAGDRYTEGVFSSLLEKNVSVIRRALKPFLNVRTQLLDLGGWMPSDQFFNMDEPTEHLNQHGRAALASRVFKAGIEILSSKGNRVS